MRHSHSLASCYAYNLKVEAVFLRRIIMIWKFVMILLRNIIISQVILFKVTSYSHYFGCIESLFD